MTQKIKEGINLLYSTSKSIKGFYQDKQKLLKFTKLSYKVFIN